MVISSIRVKVVRKGTKQRLSKRRMKLVKERVSKMQPKWIRAVQSIRVRVA